MNGEKNALQNYVPSYAPRVRVEVYFPIQDEHVYQHYLKWLIDELTLVHGGCTVLENMSGYFDSETRGLIADRVNVVYSDLERDWSEPTEREKVLDYCATLRRFLMEKLWEEEILISAYPVSHVSP
ncbi:MAG TPA: hypothetical protein VFO99_10230 [Pyrinomonadaceae bacterium]|nr:hypothetical protein [Pyrinomonadaceae bacterium]